MTCVFWVEVRNIANLSHHFFHFRAWLERIHRRVHRDELDKIIILRDKRWFSIATTT